MFHIVKGWDSSLFYDHIYAAIALSIDMLM